MTIAHINRTRHQSRRRRSTNNNSNAKSLTQSDTRIHPIPTAAAILRRRGRVDRKDIASLEDIRITTRSKNLLILASPFRMIDAVDPVLHFHDDAAEFLDRAGEIRVIVDTLGPLERDRAVLSVARVYLEGFLVRVDVDLDTRPCRL